MLETRDRELLERLLRREEAWAGYALGDLDDALFPRTRWFLSDEGQDPSLALLYSLGGAVTLLTYGAAGSIAGLVRELPLPERFHLHMPDTHAEALRPLLEGELEAHLRMALRRYELRTVPAPAGVELRPLTPDDVPAAEALYRHYPSNWFDPARVVGGLYLGAWEEQALRAIGGTHVVSERTRVAALGDFVTDPEARGGGLASALAAELSRRLFERVDLIVLNVLVDNQAGRRAYGKAGFKPARFHLEGVGLRLLG